MKYLIIIEKTATGYSAYSPDIPGCIATGSTVPQLKYTMREAILFHLETLAAEHQPLPPSASHAAYLEISAAPPAA